MIKKGDAKIQTSGIPALIYCCIYQDLEKLIWLTLCTLFLLNCLDGALNLTCSFMQFLFVPH